MRLTPARSTAIDLARDIWSSRADLGERPRIVAIDDLPNLQRRIDAIDARPGAQGGIKVPVDLEAQREGDAEGTRKFVENARKRIQT